MTDKKILSPAEALRALSEGKKLTRYGLDGDFIFLPGSTIAYQDRDAYEGDFSGFYEYDEPTPKVVWVEYLCMDRNPRENEVITVWRNDNPET